MTIKIDKKIANYKVLTETSISEKIFKMDESFRRPDMLHGVTHKLKVPTTQEVFYLTINYETFNLGTPNEHIHPVEIFINTIHPDHHEWIVAITKLCSAMFRSGGNFLFIPKEFQEIFDSQGGFRKQKKHFNSIIAYIGHVLEEDFYRVGILKKSIEEKPQTSEIQKAESSKDFKLCPDCKELAAVLLDGCLTCTSCGFSRCN